MLQQPRVVAAVVGTRVGLSDHIKDTERLFDFQLDEEDFFMLDTVHADSNSLFDTIGVRTICSNRWGSV